MLLSNTGAKNSTAVQEKLASALYEIDDEPVPLEHIHTAAEAQVDFLLDRVPRGARLLVVSGGSGSRAKIAVLAGPQLATAASSEDASSSSVALRAQEKPWGHEACFQQQGCCH